MELRKEEKRSREIKEWRRRKRKMKTVPQAEDTS